MAAAAAGDAAPANPGEAAAWLIDLRGHCRQLADATDRKAGDAVDLDPVIDGLVQARLSTPELTQALKVIGTTLRHIPVTITRETVAWLGAGLVATEMAASRQRLLQLEADSKGGNRLHASVETLIDEVSAETEDLVKVLRRGNLRGAVDPDYWASAAALAVLRPLFFEPRLRTGSEPLRCLVAESINQMARCSGNALWETFGLPRAALRAQLTGARYADQMLVNLLAGVGGRPLRKPATPEEWDAAFDTFMTLVPRLNDQAAQKTLGLLVDWSAGLSEPVLASRLVQPATGRALPPIVWGQQMRSLMEAELQRAPQRLTALGCQILSVLLPRSGEAWTVPRAEAFLMATSGLASHPVLDRLLASAEMSLAAKRSTYCEALAGLGQICILLTLAGLDATRRARLVHTAVTHARSLPVDENATKFLGLEPPADLGASRVARTEWHGLWLTAFAAALDPAVPLPDRAEQSLTAVLGRFLERVTALRQASPPASGPVSKSDSAGGATAVRTPPVVRAVLWLFTQLSRYPVAEDLLRQVAAPLAQTSAFTAAEAATLRARLTALATRCGMQPWY